MTLSFWADSRRKFYIFHITGKRFKCCKSYLTLDFIAASDSFIYCKLERVILFSAQVIKMAIQGRLLVAYVFITGISTTCAKSPLYVGTLFPMTSEHNDGWTGGNGILPAAQMAFDHVNSAGLLNDYELRMIWNDTKVIIM